MSVLALVIELASWGLALVVVPICAYLGVLALLSWRSRPPTYGEPQTRFDVLVPAHNEATGIAGTVHDLSTVDYPREMFRVVVIADNCADDTADLARAAGATVIERSHDTLRGKGYALEYAFDLLIEEHKADAFVVVDADTKVSPNLLRAFDHRLVHGEQAIQAEYTVSNVHASWRTRLLTIALSMIHAVRSIGRERLRVSTGLRGNGMCFSRQVLIDHPHKAYGLVEDVEYGIALALGGIRVAFAEEAQVFGEMVSSGGAAESQRRRWEGGRVALLRDRVPVLLGRGLKERSGLLLDMAADLLVPPVSYPALGVGVGLVLETAHTVLFGVPGYASGAWALAAGGLGLYVLRGLMLSGLGMMGVAALAWAPVYIVWKVLMVRPWRGRDDSWVRTQREAEGETDGGA